MKIEKISCTQFAGILDRDITFTDGINIIYGKNESGKSTLVNLISRTLFQNAKLDGRKDKDFVSSYFPSKQKGSFVSGDFADGKITFTTEKGRFVLLKEWGSEPRCVLTAPQGVIRDQKKINAVLKDELLYGEGVYSEMLFSSQTAADESLQTILDASKKTNGKQEIVDVVSKAFSESDGITAEAIGEAIDAKIKEIEGQHWDSSREAPMRSRTGDRWKNGLGEILNAYYAWQDAKEELERITELQSESDKAAAVYKEKESALNAAENSLKNFTSCIDAVREQRTKKDLLDRYKTDLEKLERVLFEWPEKNAKLQKARALKIEQSNREILELYEKAKGIYDELCVLRKKAEESPCPTGKEIKDVKDVQRKIEKLENKLCGMNLNAAINMLSGHSARITLLRTGEELDITNGNTPITEAVSITIPEVMEMQLTPANVNVQEIEAKITEQKSIIESVFKKYGVNSAEELETLYNKAAEIRKKLDSTQIRFDVIMGMQTYEELLIKVNAISGEVRLKKEIEQDIINVCGKSDVSRFITAAETIIESYTKDYVSISEVKAKADNIKCEIDKIEASFSAAQNIPQEYSEITDPDAYLKKLQDDVQLKREQKEQAQSEKSSALTRLETNAEKLRSDPKEKVDMTKRMFDEQRDKLRHWEHIKQVYEDQKAKLSNNPLHDIGECFTRYLGIISGEKITSEFLGSEKLDMNIYSDDRLLDYVKLSEGTKETVSLAFRLAVLEHLFPAGGGVIVFDDPFANMDSERTERSWELIKKCAENHQVIFLTCCDDYSDLSDGNIIILK